MHPPAQPPMLLIRHQMVNKAVSLVHAASLWHSECFYEKCEQPVERRSGEVVYDSHPGSTDVRRFLIH
jgi:hypothetical protein